MSASLRENRSPSTAGGRAGRHPGEESPVLTSRLALAAAGAVASVGWLLPAEGASGPRPQVGLVSSGTSQNLTAIAFADEGRGLAAGTGGTIVSTADGGNTWRTGDNAVGIDAAGIAFPDRRTAFAVGGQSVFASSDGGGSWARQETPLSTAPSSSLLSRASLNAVSFAGRLRGVAVGNDGVVIATSDGGKTWTFHGDPSLGLLTDVTLLDSKRGFAVSTVSFSSAPFSYEAGAAPAGSAHRLVAAFFTADAGKTWKARESEFGSGLLAVDFSGSHHGFATGSQGKILATTDGQTWELRRKSNADELHGIAFSDLGRGVASGVAIGGPETGRGLILTTRDGGEKWTANTVSAGPLRRVAFAGKSTAYAVGVGGTIVRIRFSESDAQRERASSRQILVPAAIGTVVVLGGLALFLVRRKARA